MEGVVEGGPKADAERSKESTPKELSARWGRGGRGGVRGGGGLEGWGVRGVLEGMLNEMLGVGLDDVLVDDKLEGVLEGKRKDMSYVEDALTRPTCTHSIRPPADLRVAEGGGVEQRGRVVAIVVEVPHSLVAL